MTFCYTSQRDVTATLFQSETSHGVMRHSAHVTVRRHGRTVPVRNRASYHGRSADVSLWRHGHTIPVRIFTRVMRHSAHVTRWRHGHTNPVRNRASCHKRSGDVTLWRHGYTIPVRIFTRIMRHSAHVTQWRHGHTIPIPSPDTIIKLSYVINRLYAQTIAIVTSSFNVVILCLFLTNIL